MARDPFGCRDELRRRILAQIGNAASPEDMATRIMSLFYEVDEEWQRLDVTQLSDPGQSFIDQRWLIARIPVQSVQYSRPIDRSVTE